MRTSWHLCTPATARIWSGEDKGNRLCSRLFVTAVYQGEIAFSWYWRKRAPVICESRLLITLYKVESELEHSEHLWWK